MLKTPEQNFQDFFFKVCLKEDRRLADVPLTESTDKFVIQNGKLEGGIGLGIVGGIVGFALGGVPAILTGITMGFALGSSLFGGNSGKKSKKPKAPTFSFDGMSGDSIATQGTAIPIIYTSNLKNPLGGVRTGGKLIACRVENRGDSGNLYAVVALSLGEIGYIDDSKLLIDNQTIDRYYEEDLDFQYLSGTPTFYNNQGQNSLTTDFNFFGQCISPNSYNLLGTSKRAQAKKTELAKHEVELALVEDVQNLYNAANKSYKANTDQLTSFASKMESSFQKTADEYKKALDKYSQLEKMSKELGVQLPNDITKLKGLIEFGLKDSLARCMLIPNSPVSSLPCSSATLSLSASLYTVTFFDCFKAVYLP